jgi:hypothetical protein
MKFCLTFDSSPAFPQQKDASCQNNHNNDNHNDHRRPSPRLGARICAERSIRKCCQQRASLIYRITAGIFSTVKRSNSGCHSSRKAVQESVKLSKICFLNMHSDQVIQKYMHGQPDMLTKQGQTHYTCGVSHVPCVLNS